MDENITVDTVHITFQGQISGASMDCARARMQHMFPDATGLVVEFKDAAFLPDCQIQSLTNWYYGLVEDGYRVYFVSALPHIIEAMARANQLDYLPIYQDFEELQLGQRLTWKAYLAEF